MFWWFSKYLADVQRILELILAGSLAKEVATLHGTCLLTATKLRARAAYNARLAQRQLSEAQAAHCSCRSALPLLPRPVCALDPRSEAPRFRIRQRRQQRAAAAASSRFSNPRARRSRRARQFSARAEQFKHPRALRDALRSGFLFIRGCTIYCLLALVSPRGCRCPALPRASALSCLSANAADEKGTKKRRKKREKNKHRKRKRRDRGIKRKVEVKSLLLPASPAAKCYTSLRDRQSLRRSEARL